MRQTKLLTGSSLNLGDGLLQTLNIDGSYGNYSHEEKDPDDRSSNSTFKNKEFDVRAETPSGRHRAADQLGGGHRSTEPAIPALGDAADYLLPTLTQNYAGFLFTEMPVAERLHLQASGRIEDVQVEGTPFTGLKTSRGFTPFSAAMGGLLETHR